MVDSLEPIPVISEGMPLRPVQQKVAVCAVLLVSILLSLYQVVLYSGWPANHEGRAWKYRTEIYARHFEQGDFFPI